MALWEVLPIAVRIARAPQGNVGFRIVWLCASAVN